MPDMPSRQGLGTSTGDFGFTNEKVYGRIPNTEIDKTVQNTLFYIPIPTVCSKIHTFLRRSMPDMPFRHSTSTGRVGTSTGDFEFTKENVFSGVPKSEIDKNVQNTLFYIPIPTVWEKREGGLILVKRWQFHTYTLHCHPLIL
jgi:hypothetical protein